MAEAERIVILAQGELELTDWSTLKKGDWRKGIVATLIRKRSLVDNGWLHLFRMDDAGDVHRRVPGKGWQPTDREALAAAA